VHVKGKLPACVKACRQAASEAIGPESNVADVAVCGVISSFFHSTVSPFLISIVAGENFMFLMATCATTGALACATVLWTALVEVEPV